jgi:cyclase
MFAKRIIPCLDCKDGRVVKGIRFIDLRDAGDPGELAALYDREGADELVMLDISASREGRATLMETVHNVALRLFIPLTVGGGVRDLEDGQRLLAAGADKVAINTAAVQQPELIVQLSRSFGSQAVVVAIDARRVTTQPLIERGNPSAWRVHTYGGTHETTLDVIDWAKQVYRLGAGEILLTSMDADGTQRGFDCELTSAVSAAVPIPVIASGGAGKPEHFADVFRLGKADAALAASVFHFDQYTIRALKEFLRQSAISVRL